VINLRPQFGYRLRNEVDSGFGFDSTNNPFIMASGIQALTVKTTFGNIGIASSTPSSLWGMTIATTTMVMGGQFAVSIASSTQDSAQQLINWENCGGGGASITCRFILNQNTAFVMNSTSSNPRDGAKYILTICQDAVGSRTSSIDLNMIDPIRFPTLGVTTTISATANTCNDLAFFYHAFNSISVEEASSTGYQIN
jgi:hypothetical protein